MDWTSAANRAVVSVRAGHEVMLPADLTLEAPPRTQSWSDYVVGVAVMLGRAAQGAPWIFRAVNAQLESARVAPEPLRSEVAAIILAHLESLYAFHGEDVGVRLARKHLVRYCELHHDAAPLRLSTRIGSGASLRA